jgi:hypothetical protein
MMCIQQSVHLRNLLVAAEWLEVAQSIVQVSRTNENIEDLNGYWRQYLELRQRKPSVRFQLASIVVL